MTMVMPYQEMGVSVISDMANLPCLERGSCILLGHDIYPFNAFLRNCF